MGDTAACATASASRKRGDLTDRVLNLGKRRPNRLANMELKNSTCTGSPMLHQGCQQQVGPNWKVEWSCADRLAGGVDIASMLHQLVPACGCTCTVGVELHSS